MGKKKEKGLFIWIIAIICSCVIIIVLYLYTFNLGLSNFHSRWAEFGAFVGGVLSPIIGLLAFIGLYYNFKLTKKQYKKDSEDNSFFKMIDLHIKKVDSISYYDISERKYESYDAFECYIDEYSEMFNEKFSRIARNEIATNYENLSDKAYQFLWNKLYIHLDGKEYDWNKEKIVNFLKKRNTNENFELLKEIIGAEIDIKDEDYQELVSIGYMVVYNATSKKRLEIIKNVHEFFYQEFGHILGHYFRNIHYMLEFIDNTSESEKYSKIYRAQLSRHELTLILYNSLSSMSSKRTVELVKKFNLLNGIYMTDIAYDADEEMIKNDLNTRIDTAKR